MQTDSSKHGKIKLQILISTFGSRIERINTDGMPQVEGVEYVISCQNPDGMQLNTSHLDGREDIRISIFNDRGISRNRNHGLDLATADYVLISDDDISYNAEGLLKLIETFDADDETDIVTTRAITPEHHVYPLDFHNLEKPWRFYSPIAFEIALRRNALIKSNVRFAESISLGTDYITCGEENFFFRRCLNAGLAGVFRNITVSEHHGPTTCTHSASEPGVRRAKGAFMPCERGYMAALVRLPVEAWRSPVNFFKALAYLTEGYCYYIRHHKEL